MMHPKWEILQDCKSVPSLHFLLLLKYLREPHWRAAWLGWMGWWPEAAAAATYRLCYLAPHITYPTVNTQEQA